MRNNSEGKVWVKVIVVLLLLVLLACGGVYAAFHYYYGLLNHGDTETKSTVEELTDSEETTMSEDDVLHDLQSKASEIVYNDNVFNILLIGSDGRTGGTSGRSDAMMLLSINKETKKISLTSIMRDIYVSIPGHGNNRLNAAYAFGQEELLKTVIEDYFGVRIDRYAQVNFYSFIDIIDAAGGVDIDIHANEISTINAYVQTLSDERGTSLNLIEVDDDFDGGILHLDGTQALAYTRVRYVGDGDFERTKRQRNVMTALKESASKMNILELNSLLNKVLPLITTDLSEGECFSLLLNSASYMSYDFETNRIPIEGTYENARINGMAVITIEFEPNRQALQDIIFNPVEAETTEAETTESETTETETSTELE
jgi:LCP family protein required for cell wall assembly